MTANPKYIVSSRTNMVLLPSVADLSLRACYIFLTSIVYFIIHLQTNTGRIGFITINDNARCQLKRTYMIHAICMVYFVLK